MDEHHLKLYLEVGQINPFYNCQKNLDYPAKLELKIIGLVNVESVANKFKINYQLKIYLIKFKLFLYKCFEKPQKSFG